MRRLQLLLGVLCCCAATGAMAGPNAGGVLCVHNTGKAFTTEPVFDPDPTVCPMGINTQMPLWDGVTPSVAVSMYWKVYATFPAGSSPRLKSVAWGTQFPEAATSPTSYVSVTNGDRVPPETSATMFFIGGNGFPTLSGGTIGQSFPPGARTTLVTPLFMFWGWGYGTDPTNPTWCLVPKTGDDKFGDDMIPANTDQIAGYGCLGFGVPGYVPCQPPSEPTGACCNLALGMPNCTITTAADCHIPFTWLGADVPCNVETCPVPPPPTGNCCNHAIPQCLISTQAACVAAGFAWLGSVACDVLTNCQAPVIPTGACCDPADACTITTEAACLASGGRWLGGLLCDPNPCPVPTGACCNTAFGFPVCNLTTAAACGGLGTPWVYLGDSVPCNAETCSLPAPSEGACCWLDGHCTITLEADCLGDGTPRWTSGGLCSPNLCDMPTVPTGACCSIAIGFPACTITTQAGCAAPDWWLGANVPCTFQTCPVPNPVERSSWGQIKNIYR